MSNRLARDNLAEYHWIERDNGLRKCLRSARTIAEGSKKKLIAPATTRNVSDATIISSSIKDNPCSIARYPGSDRGRINFARRRRPRKTILSQRGRCDDETTSSYRNKGRLSAIVLLDINDEAREFHEGLPLGSRKRVDDERSEALERLPWTLNENCEYRLLDDISLVRVIY